MRSRIDLKQVLLQLAAKPWSASLQSEEYHRLQNSDISDCLQILSKLVVCDNLGFLFLLPWDELSNDWNRNVPFWAKSDNAESITTYLWLQYVLALRGHTALVAELVRGPSMILCFKRGPDFSLTSQVLEGVRRLVVTVPTSDSGLAHFLAAEETQGKRTEIVTEQSIGSYGLLHINRYLLASSPDEMRVLFRSGMIDYVGHMCDKRLPQGFISALGAKRSRWMSSSLLANYTEDFCLSICLIDHLLSSVDYDAEVTYFFSSGLLQTSEEGWLADTEIADGSLVLMGESGAIDHYNYHLIASMVLGRASAAQKVFQRHFEAVASLRSAVAAIMARNMSHIHGSHIEHGLRTGMESFDELMCQRLFGIEPYLSIRESLGL